MSSTRLLIEKPMRIECKSYRKDGRLFFDGSDGSVTVGKLYLVLELYAPAGRNPQFRIIGDDGTPVVIDASQFELTNNKCPSAWRVEVWPNGGLVLCPEAWLRSGFWEDYFDRMQVAIQLFNEVKFELEKEDTLQLSG